jgi:tetratricopeptide (TPR) repeat protein
MKFNNALLIFFILSLVFFYTCTQKKSTESIAEKSDTSQVSMKKEKIKAFWDTYRKAQKYRIEGQWEEAARNYEKALEMDSSHEDARFNLGNMYLELKQNKKAEECWLTIIENNPNSARTHMQLGRLYFSFERDETFDIDKAKNEFLITSEINKVVTGPLMLLGHVALLEGENKTALSYLQAVIGSDTKNVEAHFLLGYIHWKNGNSGKAEQMLEKAIENSVPEKAVKGVLSEGDTKDGISYLRPINVSIFYDYFKDLYAFQSQDIHLKKSYQGIDQKINLIKKDIRS